MRIIIESSERMGAAASFHEPTQAVPSMSREGASMEDPGGFGRVALSGDASAGVEGEDPRGFGVVSFEDGAPAGAETESSRGFGVVSLTTGGMETDLSQLVSATGNSMVKTAPPSP